MERITPQAGEIWINPETEETFACLGPDSSGVIWWQGRTFGAAGYYYKTKMDLDYFKNLVPYETWWQSKQPDPQPLLTPKVVEKVMREAQEPDLDQMYKTRMGTPFTGLKSFSMGKRGIAGEYIMKAALVQCECGSERTYGVNSSHSSWCPKSSG